MKKILYQALKNICFLQEGKNIRTVKGKELKHWVLDPTTKKTKDVSDIDFASNFAYNNTIDLNTMTWDEIKDLSKKSPQCLLGAKKTISIGGHEAEIKVVDTRNNHLTFLTTVLSVDYNSNDNLFYTNYGGAKTSGYIDSKLRKHLLETIYPLLDNEIRNIIVPFTREYPIYDIEAIKQLKESVYNEIAKVENNSALTWNEKWHLRKDIYSKHNFGTSI